MTVRLTVSLGGEPVAELGASPAGELWLHQDADSDAWLSLALPPGAERFSGAPVRAWLAGLLPEGAMRERIARRLGVAVDDEVGLLAALGGDCRGAVSFATREPALADAAPAEYRRLNDDELQRLWRALRERPFPGGVELARVTLPGTWPKLAARINEQGVHLVLGNGVSTHVLRGPLPDRPGNVDNEAFCLSLAGRLGLPVVRSTLYEGAERWLMVERFDRVIASDGVRRLHQEDLASALGVHPRHRHVRDGGPGLAQCARLLRAVSARPAADLRALLRWVVFNFLVGNHAADARDLALVFGPEGPVLAPFHDLSCTAIHPSLSPRLAMPVGGEERPEWLLAGRWRALAEALGVRYAYVAGVLETMAEAAPLAAEALAEEQQARYGYSAVVQRIVRLVAERARQLEVAMVVDATAPSAGGGR